MITGVWHADFPYNQLNLARVAAPYAAGPDHCFGITTIWMLSPFDESSGCGSLLIFTVFRPHFDRFATDLGLSLTHSGTLIVPQSHLRPENPTMPGVFPEHEPHPQEHQVTGDAGPVFGMDSRIWHAVPARGAGGEPRVAVAIRYAPWWMDVGVVQPGSPTRERLAEAAGVDEFVGNTQPALRQAVYDSLPPELQPLVRHRL